MNQNERLNYLINYLLEDLHLDKDLFFGEDLFTTYRKLVNIREAKHVSFENDNNKIILWKGDITRLKVDAIVNAANNQMEGCFVPGHHCIDNAIHTYAGIQLREKCHQIMKQQGILEPTGKAKITLAYNLPSCYVIHTVGPIVREFVTKKEETLLASCYESCLNLAEKYGLKTIAFCCISTGVFHFPNDLASKIAIETVKKHLEHSTIEKVIFNVFKDEDERFYKQVLQKNL